jgi:ABC-type antimicrobial peptide transport system permease subunit
MRWRDTFGSALGAVSTHRLRSALTMLGILIGIGAVVLTVGLGSGARAQVRDQIDALGTNLLVITPGSSTDSTGARGGFGSASTLTAGDAAALGSHEAAPDIQAVAPVSTARASLVQGETNWTTTLTGTTASWQEIRSRTVAAGRFLTSADENDAAAVVVLGPDTAQELFGSADAALGQDVTTDGLRLHVVGVLAALGSSSDATSNDLALVPLSTYSQRLVGGTGRSSVATIYVKATDDSTLSAVYQEADSLLLARHGITTATNADFGITTEDSILSAATSVDDTMTVMLGGIAVISLLVGGIGVMNIMLVSVTERIREIGLRKALGGRPRAIRRQFLVEASILGLAGGVLGVGVGLLGARILPHVTDARVIVSVPAAVVAVVMAIAIGMLFGVYPASRAARLAPIDALRSE